MQILTCPSKFFDKDDFGQPNCVSKAAFYSVHCILLVTGILVVGKGFWAIFYWFNSVHESPAALDLQAFTSAWKYPSTPTVPRDRIRSSLTYVSNSGPTQICTTQYKRLWMYIFCFAQGCCSVVISAFLIIDRDFDFSSIFIFSVLTLFLLFSIVGRNFMLSLVLQSNPLSPNSLGYNIQRRHGVLKLLFFDQTIFIVISFVPVVVFPFSFFLALRLFIAVFVFSILCMAVTSVYTLNKLRLAMIDSFTKTAVLAGQDDAFTQKIKRTEKLIMKIGLCSSLLLTECFLFLFCRRMWETPIFSFVPLLILLSNSSIFAINTFPPTSALTKNVSRNKVYVVGQPVPRNKDYVAGRPSFN